MSSKMCVVFLIVLLSIITTSPLAHAQLRQSFLGPILGNIPLVGPILTPIAGPILGGQPTPPIVGPVTPINVPPVGVGQIPIVGPILGGPILGPITGPILGPITGPILGPILGPIRAPPVVLPPIGVPPVVVPPVVVPPVGVPPVVVPPVGVPPVVVPPVGVPPVVVPPVGVPPAVGQGVNITVVGTLSCSLSANVPGPAIVGANVSIICGNTTIAQLTTTREGLINAVVRTNIATLSENACVARVALPIANCTLFAGPGVLQAPLVLIGNIIENANGLVIAVLLGIFGIVSLN